MSPSLSEIADIWAATAALFAVAFAWATYVGASLSARGRTYTGLRNLIEGIQQEMELTAHWAGDDEKGDGYPRSKSEDEYFTEKLTDWGQPSRTIFRFEYPAIQSLTRSQYVSFLAPIIDDFVVLNYSIGRLYDFYSEYRQYAFSRPSLFESVGVKVQDAHITGMFRAEDFTAEELQYLKRIFAYNHKIHVELIGGKDAGDGSVCLFKIFNKAKRSLKKFTGGLKREPLPWWYWFGHVASAAFLLGAVILLLEWLGIISILQPLWRTLLWLCFFAEIFQSAVCQ